MRRWAGVAVAGLMTLTVTGCGPDFGDLPLPGKDVPGDTVEVTADFDEALNLATGATVKVNGISVGKVQEVTTKDFRAKVVMKVKKESQIREGATARLRYTTPLGELFVDVTNPEQGTPLPDRAHLTTEVTDTAPTVEDSLASASLLINGGGLSQLEQVTDELNTAIGGREETIKATFRQINTFLTNANASTGDIDRALKALANVSTVLGQREDTINRAMQEVRPAAKVLRENTDEFIALTQALVKFSGTANGIASQTKDQLITILKEVEPILAEFYGLREQFKPGLNALVTVSKAIDRTVAGDYLNLDAIIQLASVGGIGGGGEFPLPELPPILDPLLGPGGPLGPVLGIGGNILSPILGGLGGIGLPRPAVGGTQSDAGFSAMVGGQR